MPTVASIRNQAQKLTKNSEVDLNETEAWALVSKAIRRSAYYSEEEFKKLPLICLLYTSLCRDLIPKMKELKRYEDLEQDGRLLEVPCKVGDIVWYLQEQYSGKWIAKPATVSSFQFDRFLRIYCIEERQNTQAFWEEDFGKSVFLTEEAAEAALKEMEGKA